ncbi:MAG: hypothetical protein P8X61_00905 [Limibacillus sp.]
MDQLETSLFRYIWRNSKKEQIVILAMVLISLPFYYISLDLPKQIVNDGIQGQGFTSPGSTQSYFGITLPIGDGITLFQGFDLEQQGALLSLSFAFLSLVVVNGLFKFVINTRKGRLGERMLRRLRFQLTDRLLRFPLPYLRRVKQAEAATMIKDEVGLPDSQAAHANPAPWPPPPVDGAPTGRAHRRGGGGRRRDPCPRHLQP